MASHSIRFSSLKMPQRSLKCTVYLEIQTTFPGAVDTADVADLLEADTTSFELIQLVPPEGEILATMFQNSRDFLYPHQRLSFRGGAAEREMLMKRSSTFPAISPKVEFGTTSVIEESDGRDGCCVLSSQNSCSTPLRPPSSSSRRSAKEGSSTCLSKTDHFHLSPKSGREKLNVEARISTSVHSSASSSRHSPEKNKKEGKHCSPKVSENSRYQQPTVSSTIRALSPYTHRKMCQLSEDAQQRLSHLQLGPHHFRKETESQRPFLVSVCSDMSGIETPYSSPVSDSRHQPAVSFTESSLLGSYRLRTGKVNAITSKVRSDSARVRSSPHSKSEAPPETVSNSQRPPMHTCSLRESLLTNQPSTSYSEIHSRVQKILQTHKAKINWGDKGASDF